MADAVVAEGGCFILTFVQRRAVRLTRSPPVEVDARTWILDGVLSVVVGLTFVGAMLLESRGLAGSCPPSILSW